MFQHDNLVDVKEMVKERQILEKYEGVDTESPLFKARRRVTTTELPA